MYLHSSAFDVYSYFLAHIQKCWGFFQKESYILRLWNGLPNCVLFCLIVLLRVSSLEGIIVLESIIQCWQVVAAIPLKSHSSLAPTQYRSAG